jgi:hypothetical protein
MSEPAVGPYTRSSVSVLGPTLQRLTELRRELSLSERRDMSMDDVVQWMLDRIDAADLP